MLSLVLGPPLDLARTCSSVAMLGPSAPDAQAILAFAIGFVIAHVVPPSQQDVVSHVNNAIVKLANADPTNPTTAVVVDEASSNIAAAKDVAAGLVPASIVAKATST